jgi:hypothetical protein
MIQKIIENVLSVEVCMQVQSAKGFYETYLHSTLDYPGAD